jgi:hypothetical protein
MTDTATLDMVTDRAGDTTESSSTCHDTVPHNSVLSSTVLICTEMARRYPRMPGSHPSMSPSVIEVNPEIVQNVCACMAG